MSVLKADGCAAASPNLSRSNCLLFPKETKRLIFSPNLNYELELATLASETLFKAEIAAGNLFLTPDFYDVRESTINGVQVAQDNSGNTQVTRLSQNFNIKFGIKIGQCMLAKAQAWNARQVQVWAVAEDNSVEGYLTTNISGAEILKGNISQLVFDPSLPRRVNNTDIVYPGMLWLVDRDIINYSATSGFDFATIDGIVDVTILVPTPTGAAVTITVTEGCNGTGVEGLLAADLVFKNSSGVTQVPTGVTDNGNGSYTAAFSPSLGAGTYSVNLSAATIEISGSSAIYGKLPTAKSFTI